MLTSPLIAEFIPASSAHIGGNNGTVDLIVMHGTVSACVPGGARGNAHYFQNPNAGGAAHYVRDPLESIGCISEDRVAHHAPPNTGSIGVELTDWQGLKNEGDLWGDQDHQTMLAGAARLVADIASRHQRVRLEWRTADDLRAGRRDGITSHAAVAAAYHKTDHVDPGPYFPVEHFMALVTGTVAPPPPPTILEDDVAFLCEFLDEPGAIWEVHPHPMPPVPNRPADDPYHRFGTRVHVSDPPTFWRLASHGIPVHSGKVEGMELYAPVE